MAAKKAIGHMEHISTYIYYIIVAFIAQKIGELFVSRTVAVEIECQCRNELCQV